MTMTTTTQPNPEADPVALERHRLECDKIRAECEKIRAEMAELTLAWWKRPAYVGTLIPVLLGIFGLVGAWATGWFDAQKARLEANASTLQSQVDGLTSDVTSLRAEKGRLVDQNARLVAANSEQQAQIDHGYVQLKLVLDGARYALGHVESLAEPLEGVFEMDDRALGALPREVAAKIRSGRGASKVISAVVQEAEKGLAHAGSILDSLSASGWARTVRFDVETDGGVYPDGSRYDPTTRPTTTATRATTGATTRGTAGPVDSGR
jgi:hypothetical protein